MKKIILLGGLFLALFSFSTLPAGAQPRSRESFNGGWLFFKEEANTSGESLAYGKIAARLNYCGDDFLKNPPKRPATAPGKTDAELAASVPFLRPEFDDAGRRKLDLPHDWGIEGPFKQELPGGTGKLPWFGVAWYRKNFSVPAGDAGKQIYLELDGAMSYGLVFINGRFAGGWPYGYASWRADLTPFIKPGEKNVLAIRLDNPENSSRWYPGGGIYRNVWLTKTAPVAVAQWGVYVTTPEISPERATVNVAVTLENKSPADAAASVVTTIYELDDAGNLTGGAIGKSGATPGFAVAAGNQSTCEIKLEVPAPKLWSLEARNRYAAETVVLQDGKTLDRVVTPFGIRTIAHTPNDGFLLNGKRVPIRGVCQHHDLGALGTALNVRALERQLEILQSMGCNAIRTSHNPPAPELLDLCDRMGFLVMDEAFDCWSAGKTRNDYGRLFKDWHEKDLRALIRRDRNHPCVIQWSVGNEIRELRSKNGKKPADRLVAIVRSEDLTRPVSAGCDSVSSGYSGVQKAFDFFGYNYKPHEYAKFKKANPTLPLIGSETASTISSRGEYFFPVTDNRADGRGDFQMSSYDLYTPGWAQTPDTEWRAQAENPFVLGEYVWTGFDYLGEPTPYNSDTTVLSNFKDPAEIARAKAELEKLGKIRVPSRSSYFGIVDLAGFPKDRYYLYQSHWLPEKPMAHILPHWNWPERVGQVTPVHVYTSGDEAELFLNGKSLGKKSLGKNEFRFRWNDVVYEPGELKVVVRKNGNPWAQDTVRTTGAPAKLLLAPDRATIAGDGKDLSFVTATIADEDDRLVPRSKNAIKFSVSGGGEIVATDNGDATSFESFQSPLRKAFNGLALVIVRAKPGAKGEIKLRAESEGLAPAEVVLRSEL